MLIQPQFLKLQADPGPLPLTCSPGPWHPWVQAAQYLGRRGLFTAQAWGLTRLQPCSPKFPPQSVLGGVAGTIPEAIKPGDLHGAGASTREIYFTGDAWWLTEAITLTWRRVGTSRGHLEGPGALGSVGLAALPCCLLDSLVQGTATEEGRSRRS